MDRPLFEAKDVSEEAWREVGEDLNRREPALAVVLANSIERQKGTARITAVSATSWSVEVSSKKVLTVGWKASTPTEATMFFMNAYRRALRPTLDPVLGPTFLILMILLISVLADAQWAQPFRIFALYIFRVQAGLWALFALTVAIHAFESLYAFTILRRHPFAGLLSNIDIFNWLALTLLLGAAALRPLTHLDHLITTASTTNAEQQQSENNNSQPPK